ncbi:MAG: orotate phosphoribosyltransferase [bacterium]|nr:orotate phosphoribosyltransferase [bacterium]
MPDLRSTGALLEGHFILSSGLHSNRYVQCALYLQHPELAERAGRELAFLLKEADSALEPTVVISPAMGGLIIGHECGRALGVRAVFAERVEGVMTLRRGFSLSRDDRVVVVEDVVTTGKSTGEVVEVVSAAGVKPVALACVVDRRGADAPPMPIPLVSLARLEIEVWKPEVCPLCAKGDPAEKPGSRTPR